MTPTHAIPRCLAFDLGKVLFDFDYTIALDRIKNSIKVPIKTVMEELFVHNFSLDFEKGLVSSKAFYAQFTNAFGATITYDTFVDVWADIFTPKRDVIALLERLRLIYPVYLISNINELHYEHLYAKYPKVFALFDELLLSYKLNSLKPEEKIYARLAEVSGCPYQEIVYIDDREDLTKAAECLGLSCIPFQNYAQLLDSLKQKKIQIPTQEESATLMRLQRTIAGARRPLIVGIGNALRADDGAGAAISERIAGKIKPGVITAGASIENYLGKITRYDADRIIILDAADFRGPERFELFEADQLKNISLHLTHDSSLKLALAYLQNTKPSDILVLAIKPKTIILNEPVSAETNEIQDIIGNFFLKNFPDRLNAEL